MADHSNNGGGRLRDYRRGRMMTQQTSERFQAYPAGRDQHPQRQVPIVAYLLDEGAQVFGCPRRR